MKNLIEEYNKEYRSYKNNLYFKLSFLLFVFVAPFIPLAIYFNQSGPFLKTLFWIFASIIFIILLVFLALSFYVSERPMYEFLYKKVIDQVFEDDPTHYEYESFPLTIEFIEKGKLFSKAHSEVVRYRLSYYYLNNRIDIYSFYAYSKTEKSNKPVFNGIYMVLHCNNQSSFEIRTKGKLKYINDQLKKIESNERYEVYRADDNPLPHYANKIFNDLINQYNKHIYISGARKEIHIAIDELYNDLAPKELNEDQLNELKKQISSLVSLGRSIYKSLE
ncbi:hypothetical protein KHQ88_00455 [Mycoplasmatota bacterium]|nr:hypothetical protein KHQ88_00455 [Mycoplasmatota bacterium]